jgi:hypothetical protein
LFMTSWLIDDFLADNEFFGAATAGNALTILSSASSKTAYGTAFCLAKRQGVTVIGLTSAANLDFCRSLGCYHRVLTYDQIDQLDPGRAAVYVDFAGNAACAATFTPGFRCSATAARSAAPMSSNSAAPTTCPARVRPCSSLRRRSRSAARNGAARCSDNAC